MTQTINRNPALQTSFKMEIPHLEEFNYFVQETELPGLSMSDVNIPFRNNQTSVPGNRIDYDPIQIPFIVSEDYENHTAIRLWMHRIAKGPGPLIKEMKDVSLFITNSNKNTVKRVLFYAAYPIGLTRIPLQSSVSDVEPIVCTLTLKYQFYDFKPPT